jgi:hypothetical protein
MQERMSEEAREGVRLLEAEIHEVADNREWETVEQERLIWARITESIARLR